MRRGETPPWYRSHTMSRFYFYHANYYTTPKGADEAPQQGEVHGIWVVEDESTPDVILAALETWLYEDWEKRAQTTGMPASVNFAITQFNPVQ
jgi:hypothetical protein